jgi:predicted metal-dependent hydrolase
MQLWPGMKIVFRRRRHRKVSSKTTTKAYLDNKKAARALITARLEHFNQFYNFTYNRVAIRDTKRSWGSCSAKKNLNFNYKLLFLPACLRDYVVVHELCHLKELHHQASFWMEVKRAMPDCKRRAVTLRHHERTSGTSLPALAKLSVSHSTCPQCASV